MNTLHDVQAAHTKSYKRTKPYIRTIFSSRLNFPPHHSDPRPHENICLYRQDDKRSFMPAISDQAAFFITCHHTNAIKPLCFRHTLQNRYDKGRRAFLHPNNVFPFGMHAYKKITATPSTPEGQEMTQTLRSPAYQQKIQHEYAPAGQSATRQPLFEHKEKDIPVSHLCL